MHVEDGGSNKRNVYILTCLLVHLLKYILDILVPETREK